MIRLENGWSEVDVVVVRRRTARRSEMTSRNAKRTVREENCTTKKRSQAVVLCEVQLNCQIIDVTVYASVATPTNLNLNFKFSYILLFTFLLTDSPNAIV